MREAGEGQESALSTGAGREAKGHADSSSGDPEAADDSAPLLGRGTAEVPTSTAAHEPARHAGDLTLWAELRRLCSVQAWWRGMAPGPVLLLLFVEPLRCPVSLKNRTVH